MAQRSIHRLTDRAINAARSPGNYTDGGGLYLSVVEGSDPDTGKTWLRRAWIFRYATGEVRQSRTGKSRRVEREMGLGSYPDTTLAEAREKARLARKARDEGTDPIDAKREAETKRRIEKSRTKTFDEAGAEFIKSQETGWRNAKHIAQWSNTLRDYASPIIGKLPVRIIDTPLVMQVLEQEVTGQDGKPARLWDARPETASRLRGRIERILSWAKVHGYRTGENPAQWRGHLDQLLPKKTQVRAVEHHAALPYAELPEFMSELRDRTAVAARALEFTILTASRTGEVIGAKWEEIDYGNRIWTVPPKRMKGKREHRVTLSDAALDVLAEMQADRINEFVFPGDFGDGLSNMSMLMLLRRMDYESITVHGFRSTFKTWAAEQTNHQKETVESALAHVNGDKVEAAYQRGEMLDKRRRLMEAWGQFALRGPTDNVLRLSSNPAS